MPHLVHAHWPDLGPTWNRGVGAAIGWYRKNPAELEEQVRRTIKGGEVTRGWEQRVEAQDEEVSAPATPPAPPPDLGGGTFRCDRCGECGTFAAPFDGHIHRRDRCGGTWRRMEKGDVGGLEDGVLALTDAPADRQG